MGDEIIINGRFLTQRVTGVQRYAREMIGALDELIRPDEPKVELLCPQGAQVMPGLRRIRQVFGGTHQGHKWEQFDLPRIANGRPLVCLCNMAPLWARNAMVVIHDAAVFDVPEGYGRAYRLWYRMAHRVLAWRGVRIVTVSRFSRERLSECLGLAQDRIGIVGGAVDHMARIEPDASVLKRLELEDTRFVLTVGSLAPTKNIQAVIRAMGDARLQGVPLVIAGGRATAVTGGADPAAKEGGLVHFTGYVTDEQMLALLMNASLFVFPSRYEGFGLPPLEAMWAGCPVIASNAAAIPEICGTGVAAYFDPDDVEKIASLVFTSIHRPFALDEHVKAGKQHAQAFNWSTQARSLLDVALRQLRNTQAVSA